MKNALLVTLWDNKNFGNRLQTIALKRIIEDNGFQVTCAVAKEHGNRSYICFLAIRFITISLGMIGIKKYRTRYLNYLRERQFQRDNNRYLRPTTRTIKNYIIESPCLCIP